MASAPKTFVEEGINKCMDGWLEQFKKLYLKKTPSFGLSVMCIIFEIGQMTSQRED